MTKRSAPIVVALSQVEATSVGTSWRRGGPFTTWMTDPRPSRRKAACF